MPGWNDLLPWGPYDDASGQLDKYRQMGQGEFDKAQGREQGFVDKGNQAFGPMWQAMMGLLDPSKLQDQWASGYKESPYAKQMEGMATQNGLDAASSMGLMGSSPALSAIQAGTSQIGNADRQQYMNDLMQKYQLGTGMAGNIYGTGANMAGTMGNQSMDWIGKLMGMGQDQASLAANSGLNTQNMFGNLLGGMFGGGYNSGQDWTHSGRGPGGGGWN